MSHCWLNMHCACWSDLAACSLCGVWGMLEPEQRKSRELDLNLDSTGWGILEKFPASEHACHLSKVGVGEGKEYEEMAKPPFTSLFNSGVFHRLLSFCNWGMYLVFYANLDVRKHFHLKFKTCFQFCPRNATLLCQARFRVGWLWHRDLPSPRGKTPFQRGRGFAPKWATESPGRCAETGKKIICGG